MLFVAFGASVNIMRTKLVYVLNCMIDKTYVEQALMSVYSARYWNPDAYIVLVVDDMTDGLLTGERGEILKYISEKKVVSFPDNDNMMYRSRWLKTSIRQIVEGDFLFIDCDTLCQKPLDDIDGFDCQVGAVYESHLPVSSFCEDLLNKAKSSTSVLGVGIEEEKYYFSSGVLYVKDTPRAHELFEHWHSCWLESSKVGICIDQPALAKANKEVGHIIERIPDSYNCILFTRNSFTSQAHILHITSFMNPCLLFEGKTLSYVRNNGVEGNDWLIESITHPCRSFLPFDYDVLHSSFAQRNQWIDEMSRFYFGYGMYIDPEYSTFMMKSRFRDIVVVLMRRNHIRFALSCWMLWKRVNVIKNKAKIKDNICRS